MSSSHIVVPGSRPLPRSLECHVELTRAEVLEQLRSDPDVQVVTGFPAPGRSDRRFLVELGRTGFRVCKNLTGEGVVDTGPAVLRRLALEADLFPTPRGTRVIARFAQGPMSRQASFCLMWAASLAWLGLTGTTPAKLGLVAVFLALTVPAFVYDLMRAHGTDADRLELLNFIAARLGPAALGEAPADHTPYRHGQPAPVRDESA